MRKRLPELNYQKPPPEEAQRFNRWLAEWEFNREEKVASSESHLRDLLSSSDFSNRFSGSVRAYDTSPETLEPGVVRLFSADLLDPVDRPVYGLILEDWDEDHRLVAVFSPFSEPATTTEYLTGRNESPLRVLSCWNAFSIPVADLIKGWMAARFTPDQLEEARVVFRHALTGDDLPQDLEDRNGPPVVHPLDPRVEYQDEESRILAPLLLASLEQEDEKNEKFALFALPASPSGKGLRDAVPFALAAAEKGVISTPGFLYHGTLPAFLAAVAAGIQVDESVKFSSKLLVGPSEGASIQWDVEGSVAGNREGAVFALINAAENTVIGVGEIEDGTALLPIVSCSTTIAEKDLDRFLIVVFDSADA